MNTYDFDSKSWYASKTVWGGLVALLCGIGQLGGYIVAPEDQETLSGLLTAVGASVGGILSIIGRLVATRTIRGSK